MKRLLAVCLVVVLLVPVSGCAGQRLVERATAKAASSELASFMATTPQAADQVLFRDDFQDGNSDGWKITGSWTVQQDGDKYYLNAPGPAGVAFVPKGVPWTDYLFRAAVRLDAGGMAMGFRASTEGQYLLYYRQDALYLLKEYPKGKFNPLTQTAAPPLNTAHVLGIGGSGGHLQVYVDQALQLDYTDPSPLTKGTIGVAALEGCRAAVDNVLALKLTETLPVAVPTELPATVAAPSTETLQGEWEPIVDTAGVIEEVPSEDSVTPTPGQ
jgi:hypothetical protein